MDEGKLMAITYKDAKNPKWLNAEKNMIDLEVNFDHLEEDYVPFTASPTDSEAHCVAIYNKAAAGDFGTVADYTPPTSAENLYLLRKQRNYLLAQTDWWAMSDLTMTDAQKKYRQDLRDITKTATSLDDVSWPSKPS
tara:strand:- start:298 stop:708 length:411 start_codon:yes stop_codon:yes gene_type:complete